MTHFQTLAYIPAKLHLAGFSPRMLIPCSKTLYFFCFSYRGFLFFILISHSLQLFQTSTIMHLILPVDLEFRRSTDLCGMVLLTYLIR